MQEGFCLSKNNGLNRFGFNKMLSNEKYVKNSHNKEETLSKTTNNSKL